MSEFSEYSNHKQQRDAASPPKSRLPKIEESLLAAFEDAIEYRLVPVVIFDQVSVEMLSAAFYKYPILIKSVLATVNIAQRAIKRDLGVAIDTYSESITQERAGILAGYVKPLLPKEMALPAILLIDEYLWIDKEMRASKGRWEKRVNESLCRQSGKTFRKRMFLVDGDKFEIDSAYPPTGSIQIGVDVKRFESPQDFHKRGDEITQKCRHLKSQFPKASFFAVIYFPYPSKHDEVRSRYGGNMIDGILFAGEDMSSIDKAVDSLLDSGPDLLSTELF